MGKLELVKRRLRSTRQAIEENPQASTDEALDPLTPDELARRSPPWSGDTADYPLLPRTLPRYFPVTTRVLPTSPVSVQKRLDAMP